MDTYYDVLGLSRKPSKEELATGYMLLACEYHPENTENSSERTERFRLIGEAFCVLYDTKMRFAYDKVLANNLENDLPGRVHIELSQAKSVFREMLTNYIAAELGEEDDPEEVLNSLLAMKCPPGLAERAVLTRHEHIRADIRSESLRLFMFSLFILSIGAGLTLWSISISAGGTFWVWTGMIIIGCVFSGYAIHCLTTGRRPRVGNPISLFLGVR